MKLPSYLENKHYRRLFRMQCSWPIRAFSLGVSNVHIPYTCEDLQSHWMASVVARQSKHSIDVPTTEAIQLIYYILTNITNVQQFLNVFVMI